MSEYKKKIKLFNLILLTVSGIVSLKSLPIFAEVGLSIIFFLTFSTFCFFIPIAMAISELTSTWPMAGGCYIWIKKSFGESVAFIVIWAYWMQSIIWFPTMLIFIIAMLSNIFFPFSDTFQLNVYFSTCGIILIFWILTFLNFFGVKVSSSFSIFGVIFGTILPIILIISLGIFYLLKGDINNISININSLIPNFNLNNLVFLSGILLGISGIELITFYINDIESPETNLYKSIIISSFIILILYSLSSISISIIIPKSDICLASGIIVTFKYFLNKIGLPQLTPLIAFLLFLGSISCVNTWLIGPAKGLLVAADDGFLPKIMTKLNKHEVPTYLLILQALIVSFLSIIFLLYINTINGLVWIFVCLSFQFAAFLYIMIFISVLRLRKKYPNINRPFKMPFINFFSYIGILMCLFTFFLSYIQPNDIDIMQKKNYIFILIISFFLLMVPSFLLIFYKKKINIKNDNQ